MSKQKHSMQPKPNHDESVRQDFVTELRAYLTDEIYTLITPHYEKKIEPEFLQSHDRKPKDKSEVKVSAKGYSIPKSPKEIKNPNNKNVLTIKNLSSVLEDKKNNVKYNCKLHINENSVKCSNTENWLNPNGSL